MASIRTPPLGRVRDAALTWAEYIARAGRNTSDTRVVAVVGMHRSGTSAVAGTLQSAGLYLGNVLRKHESNRRGTRENLEIVALHDAILAHSGGSWRNAPPRVTWTDAHRCERDRIVAEYGGAGLWGFKDPRTILLLDFWREALGESLTLVGVYREPGAVALSLVRRDGGTPDEWLKLWVQYNARLLREHEEREFPLVEFVAQVERFDEQVVPVLRALGLRARTQSGFFDPALAAVDEPARASADAVALYERLCAARG